MKYILYTAFVVLSCSAVLVYSDGKLGYGDKCSVTNAVLQIFSSNGVSPNEKCNGNKGLICTGTCTCPPTRVWYNGPFFGLFGGGGCIVGANGPCAQGDTCVANAVCGVNIPLCLCEEGYYAHDLQCIKSGSRLSSGTSSLKSVIPYIFTASIVAALFNLNLF